MDDPLDNQAAHMSAEIIDGLIAAAGIEGAQEILDAFWRSTTELLEALSTHARHSAFDMAAMTAHAVKGSAANVGAQRLALTAAKIEAACKRSDQAALLGSLEEARQNFETVKSHFDDHLSKK